MSTTGDFWFIVYVFFVKIDLKDSLKVNYLDSRENGKIKASIFFAEDLFEDNLQKEIHKKTHNGQKKKEEVDGVHQLDDTRHVWAGIKF